MCQAAPCPTVLVPIVTPAGVKTLPVDRYTYVSTKYEVYEEKAWENLGYLAIFILAFQVMAFVSLRYVRHISR